MTKSNQEESCPISSFFKEAEKSMNDRKGIMKNQNTNLQYMSQNEIPEFDADLITIEIQYRKITQLIKISWFASHPRLSLFHVSSFQSNNFFHHRIGIQKQRLYLGT